MRYLFVLQGIRDQLRALQSHLKIDRGRLEGVTRPTQHQAIAAERQALAAKGRAFAVAPRANAPQPQTFVGRNRALANSNCAFAARSRTITALC